MNARRACLWMIANDWRRSVVSVTAAVALGVALAFLLEPFGHFMQTMWLILPIQFSFYAIFDWKVPSATQAAARLKFLSDIPRGKA